VEKIINAISSIFHYGIIKSHPLNICKNCNFMELFLYEKKNKWEGSQIVLLESVCQFTSNINFSSLFNVTEDTFKKNCFIASYN